MADFVKVATLSQVPPGKATTVEVAGSPVALYNVGGTVYATTNTCPHRGGPLGEGDLDERVVTCPWHSFQYDVTNGTCLTNPAVSLVCHKVRLDGQNILVQI